jgi:hypothetical protein
MRAGDISENSGLGATDAAETLRSQVSARAIEAVCRLTANSLVLETLMRMILDTASSARTTFPFASEARPNEAAWLFELKTAGRNCRLAPEPSG